MKSYLILEFRERNNLTQEQLGQILGCSDGRISQLESDKYSAVLTANEIQTMYRYDNKFDIEAYLEISLPTKEDPLRYEYARRAKDWEEKYKALYNLYLMQNKEIFQYKLDEELENLNTNDVERV